jgi:ectoine hydroxylase
MTTTSAPAPARLRPGDLAGSRRKAMFFGYTFRWIAIRDENDGIWASDWADRLSPVQRQLLGGLKDTDGDHAWGHYPATTPLHGWLQERNLLDPASPPLRP